MLVIRMVTRTLVVTFCDLVVSMNYVIWMGFFKVELSKIPGILAIPFNLSYKVVSPATAKGGHEM